jgi:holo-[acyl-carrier protein] synthase
MSSPIAGAPVGLGIDHCEVDRLRRAMARHGRRFLERVFTPGERAYCDAFRRDPETHYAARFAAKEATAKALGSGIAMGVNWREIEVTRAPGSPPEISIHGRARQRAERLGIGRLLLTITHTDDLASAVVIAISGESRNLSGGETAP